MGETITQENVLSRYKSDMQVYAIALNRKQSVPDYRDGLKSVDRRVITDMYIDKHLTPNCPYIKSAGTVGSTMELYHAHGDSSIYDVLCKLASWWKVKMPLIDGHGNYGNMQGDGAAAMRYTEAKLSEFGYEAVIGDLSKSKYIVDWVPNYDESKEEPKYLPAKVPLLLINGTFGIGIGMRSEISSHNLAEVLDATIKKIKNPNYNVVLIPDHRMPCDIVDTNWKRICNTGFGTYICRARIDIEQINLGSVKKPKIHNMLVIKSVPDNVTLSNSAGLEDKGVIATIDKLTAEGKLAGIKDHYDDSKGNDLRYCIVLENTADPYFIKDYLYAHTQLQKTFRENFEVLDDYKPMRLSYDEYINLFIDFAIDTKFKTYAALYKETSFKLREKQLYIMVIESGEIENIQKKIRKMKDVSAQAKNEFMEYLIKKFNVTDIEAKFIMNMDQMRTARGYLDMYKQEAVQLEADRQRYFEIISDNSETYLKNEVIKELEYFKKKYGTPRLCRVIKDTGSDIPEGEFLVVVTESNRIRKIPVGENINAVRGDNPKFVLKIDNTAGLLLYDKNGKIFKLPVHKINLCDKFNNGQDLRILIKGCTSDIVTIMSENSLANLASKVTKYYLVVITMNGSIKKMDLDDFLKVPPSGILYTKLTNGDSVRDIAVLPDSVDIVVYTKDKALRFGMDQVPHYKRSALGVNTMKGDQINGFSVITKDCEYIIIITKSGKINKIHSSGLVNKQRNQAGVGLIKLASNDEIQNILGANDSDTLLIGTTKSEMNQIPIKELNIKSSKSTGKKIIPTKGDIIITSSIQ